MALSPQFAATPRCAVAQVTTANTARDGTGTIATVLTPGASGSRVDAIVLKAIGTTTAGMIRLFIHDGTNARLVAEAVVTPVVPAANQPSWEATLNQNTYAQFLPLVIPAGSSLRASTEKTETFNVIAIGGDF